jgi:hypothetical protein
MTQEIILNNLAFSIFYTLGDYFYLFLGLGVLIAILSILIGVLITK